MTGTTEDLAEKPNFVADAFSEVLDIVHVRGNSAQILGPDHPRALSVPAGQPCIYIVEQGEMAVRVDSGQTVELREKQIALLLHGVAHDVRLGPPGPLHRAAAVDHNHNGGSHHTVHCFRGSFTIDGDLAANILRSLPEVIVLSDLAENPIEWIDVVCKVILAEMGASRPGASVMVSRLLDLLLVKILRRWAQSADGLPGWLAAVKDDRIARAVSVIHSDPSRSLTNAELADLAGMSLSSFTDRFALVMGQQPGAYVRGWRLDRGAEALLRSSASIDVIADRVGYASKEAFSRAFQARFGVPPSTFRASRQDPK